MKPVHVTRTIDAPVAIVFETIAHIDNFSKAVPKIVRTEIISEIQTGVGACFRETRLMNGKHITTELEVTQYVKNECVRLIADSGGAIWDTLFTVEPQQGNTLMNMQMESRPYRLMPRAMHFLIAGLIRKEVEKDMDAVKLYCESIARST
jgi:hypothetical protein